MFHQERRTKVAQAGQLQFFQILAKIDTGDTGKATCQVLNLIRLQCAQFGKDTMFDFAVFTIRLSKSVLAHV